MNLRDFLGGHPAAVILRLALISILVGVLLSFLGVTPRNFLSVIDDFARYVYDLGFTAVEWLASYLVVGAMLVVPIWFLVRLIRARPSRPPD